jgi:hypothetical protein
MATGFFASEKLGPHQSVTPEGFLIVENTPIARCGLMIYGPEEISGIAPGADGVIRVTRQPDEVFRPAAIGSAQGKSVTNDHPDDDVTPLTWKEKTIGVVLNPRRGEGIEEDLLIADLLITDKAGIELVRAGKRELSCGYDADYVLTGPGQARQENIIINHVALVESGRCGPRCAIGDRDTLKDTKMNQKKTSFKDLLLRAFKAKDAEEVERIAAELPPDEKDEDGGTHIHIHAPTSEPLKIDGRLDVAKRDEAGAGAGAGGEADRFKALETAHEQILARLGAIENDVDDLMEDDPEENEPAEDARRRRDKRRDARRDARRARRDARRSAKDDELESNLAAEAPEGMDDKARKARDSAYLADSFQDTVAMAEILAPGIRIPTFDRAASPKASFDAICRLRRSALDLAFTKPETRSLIEDLNGGRTLDTGRMTCDAVRTLFRAAAAARKRDNNGAATRNHAAGGGNNAGANGTIQSLADLNRRNSEFHGANRR